MNEETQKDEMTAIIEAIKSSGAIEQAAEVSEKYLKKAFHELEGLPENKARKILSQIAKNIGKRKF